MKVTFVSLSALLLLAGPGVGLAEDLKDKVKFEAESGRLPPGMEPGMYVCAGGHLHIQGRVQNLAEVALGRIKVAGKAFGSDDKLLGTATATTRVDTLRPGEYAAVDLEFVSVTGPKIKQVKRHEVAVIEAPRKR